MSADGDESAVSILSPDDAFAVLGNETRMEIIQALGEATEPTPFSELRDRVGVSDSGQFNYHLDKLVGHFVRQTEGGYELRQAGQRIIEAVLSGAVTDVPKLEPTRLDSACPYCDAPISVRYEATSSRPVILSCTECAGAAEWIGPFEHGQLGTLRFSPAGLYDRTPDELAQAATTWEHLEILAADSGVCPRCTAPVEPSITVCDTHESPNGVCPNCQRHYAAQGSYQCTNCPFRTEGGFVGGLVFAHGEVLAFLTRHRLNPLTDPWGPVIEAAEEEILSIDPFRARVSYRLNDENLTLTVDGSLNVVETSKSSPGESC